MEINSECTMITIEMLLEAAKRKRLTNKEHIEKDYYQDLLLFHLHQQTNKLIFKGGTALYKLYQLPRFSEDLDFSLIGETDLRAILTLAVEKIPEAKINEIKELQGSFLCRIRFSGIITSGNTVRIDISMNNPLLEKFDVKNYVPTYPDLNPFALRVMNVKEIVAEKIHALFAREKSRDLYDLFFLLRFVEFDKNLVQKKLSHFKMRFDGKKIAERIDNLEAVWEKELTAFILGKLPPFEIIRDFVMKRLKG